MKSPLIVDESKDYDYEDWTPTPGRLMFVIRIGPDWGKILRVRHYEYRFRWIEEMCGHREEKMYGPIYVMEDGTECAKESLRPLSETELKNFLASAAERESPERGNPREDLKRRRGARNEQTPK